MRRNGWSDHIVRSRGRVHHGLSARIILRHLARGQRWASLSDVGEKGLSGGHERFVGGFQGADSFDVLFDFPLHARYWKLG